MNKKENNFKYKYLKYKNKYLELKNKGGGIEDEICRIYEKNLEHKQHPRPHYEKNLEHKQHPHYKKETGQCCTSANPHVDCIDIHPKINQINIRPGDKSKTNTIIYNGYDVDNYHENYIQFGSFIISDTSNGTSKKFFRKGNISEGSYGLVSQYINNDTVPPQYIAVKYGDIRQDLKVIKYMENHSNKCSELLIKYTVYKAEEFNKDEEFKQYFNHVKLKKYFEDDGKNLDCIIMENAVGTIADLIPVITRNKEILIDILYAVVIAIKCLYDIGLYYVDIKMENILYRITDAGIQIILGDLGGIVKIDEQSLPTFPPYEYFMNDNGKEKGVSIESPYKGDNIVEKNAIISWGIAALSLALLNIHAHGEIHNRFETIVPLIKAGEKEAILGAKVISKLREKVKVKTKAKLENPFKAGEKEAILENPYIMTHVSEINNQLKNKYPELINLISNILCNYKKRWRLDQIIPELNKLRKHSRMHY